MLIALDYDDTFTADPEYWKEVMLLSRKYGHKIHIVTMRCPIQDVIPEAEELLLDFEVPIIYADGKAKREVTEALGHNFHIWIDDKPSGIDNGSTYTPDQLVEWRKGLPL